MIRHMSLQQAHTLVDQSVEFQSSDQSVNGADASIADGAFLLTYGISNIAPTKHRVLLIAVVLPMKTAAKFLRM